MKSKNLPLIIGISLPLLFILIISAVVFLPSLTVNPQHNFLYTTEVPYNTYSIESTYGYNYKVENNKIVLESIPAPENEPYLKEAKVPTLYVYDVQNGTSHEITQEEAEKLNLVAGPSSPDGYNVDYQYSHDGVFELFGSSGNNGGYYIGKGNAKKKLDALGELRIWNGSGFRLIGWVK